MYLISEKNSNKKKKPTTKKNFAAEQWNLIDCGVIGVTRTNTCRCRSCDAFIESNTIRLGMIYEHANGYILLHWFHLTCYPFSYTKIQIHEFEGYEFLDAQKRKELHDLYRQRRSSSYLHFQYQSREQLVEQLERQQQHLKTKGKCSTERNSYSHPTPTPTACQW